MRRGLVVFGGFMKYLLLLALCCFFVSCARTNSNREESVMDTEPKDLQRLAQQALSDTVTLDSPPSAFDTALRQALEKATIPPKIAERILADACESPAFTDALSQAMNGDPYLHFLVDKRHPLPDKYAPSDLVELETGTYQVNRTGLMLRKATADSLHIMAKAAKADGVTLTASSAYRSYTYQVEVYNRNVKEMGQEAADRESARPGYSQHQTGLVVDFGSIDDSFAQTQAGRWMLANASRFGWSLSFPDGYENITGYRWESWHYRYVGTALIAFIDTYFDGIQQFALQFIHEWEQSEQ
jgi:D-alanyl-D-alanine carboxypeptidase